MKTIGTMLCLASLLLLAACTAGPEEAAGTQDAPLPGAAVATCRVVDVQDGQLILAAAYGGENDVNAHALGDLPVTYEDPSQTEIVPGNQIQIGYGGTVEETFPARLGNVEAIRVQVDGFDNLCALYLQVFQDLWDTDTALNQGIVQLGLDLSQTRLTPAEQSAVGVALGNRWDLPVHQATWEELVQAGTIDGENLQWEDGLFLAIREEDPSADSLTFTAEKWRSGLGAYYFTDCTARQDAGGQWSAYTVGAEAIA